MPSWKKLIVSGSDATLNSLSVVTSVTANSFVKLGGTSSQFLKADGSVDSTVYQPLLTSPVTGTGSSGQVTFWTGSTTQAGDNDLFWNNINKRLGIGTTTPTEKLTVNGNMLITNALLSNQQNLDVDSGATRVIATASTTYQAVFFDFVIKKSSSMRAGTIYSVYDGTNVEFTETSTNDLGNTDEVVLSVDVSGGNIRLLATTQSNDWSIKTLIRGL